jgi:hypothetical protein
MVYDIELISRAGGRTAALALEQEIYSLVGDSLASIIERAEELYRELAIVPRPDGYRIRESGGGDIVHEYREKQNA